MNNFEDIVKPAVLQAAGVLGGVISWLQTANEVMGIAVAIVAMISFAAAIKMQLTKNQYYKNKHDNEKMDH